MAGPGSRGRTGRPAPGPRRRRAVAGRSTSSRTSITSSATWSSSSGESRSQCWVANAASSHTGSDSALDIHARVRSICRCSASASAACAAATAAVSSANSCRDHLVPGAASRHQRSRRSLASSGASTTSSASARTFRWWLALPTAWPVRSASPDAVDGPSTLSASMIRARNGWASAARALASVRRRMSERGMAPRLDQQELLYKSSCGSGSAPTTRAIDHGVPSADLAVVGVSWVSLV